MDWISLSANWSVLHYFPWLVFHCWCFAVSEKFSSERRSRRFKRIVYGIVLSSHDQLDTQYMVALKETFGCESALEVARVPDCDAYEHKCGGALVAPDFVLTACHCIVDEFYHVQGVKLPPFHPSFDGWTSSTTEPPEDVEIPNIFVRRQPLHPIYNTLSLWMGNVDTENMPQRQFAKAFFPHSNCSIREVFVHARAEFEEETLVRLAPTTQDIGLVRTWNPFALNNDVKLINLKHGDDMLRFHRSVMATMAVCLFTGFGVTEDGRVSRFLRYTFRHVQCSTNCLRNKEYVYSCEICSTSVARPDKGIKVANLEHGDSGSPLVCEEGGTSYLIGVLSSADTNDKLFSVNATNALFASVACIRDFLTKQHLQHLREVNDQNPVGNKLDQAPMGFFEGE